jgi:hypothetical protein
MVTIKSTYIIIRIDFVKLWVVPLSNPPTARLWLQNKTQEDFTPKSSFRSLLRKWERDFSVYIFEAVLNIAATFPILRNTLISIIGPLSCLPTKPFVNRSDLMFTCGYVPVHAELEYSVPAEKSQIYLQRYLNLCREKQYPQNFITEVRFVKGDDIWMSGAYGNFLNEFFLNSHRKRQLLYYALFSWTRTKTIRRTNHIYPSNI